MAKDLVAVEKTGAAPDRRALKRVLTPAQYGDLAEVPPELEWLANIGELAAELARLAGEEAPS